MVMRSVPTSQQRHDVVILLFAMCPRGTLGADLTTGYVIVAVKISFLGHVWQSLVKCHVSVRFGCNSRLREAYTSCTLLHVLDSFCQQFACQSISSSHGVCSVRVSNSSAAVAGECGRVQLVFASESVQASRSCVRSAVGSRTGCEERRACP